MWAAAASSWPGINTSGATRGFRRIEVDAYGREFGQLDSVFPTPGANVYLTLDNRLQQEAEACLEGKVGAIVALDPRSGKILAMASSPTFSQEAFERGLSHQEWQRLSTRQNPSPGEPGFEGPVSARVPLLRSSWRWPAWKKRSSPPTPSSTAPAP